MAEPILFDNVNCTWFGEGDVGALPVFRDTDTGENIFLLGAFCRRAK